MKDRCLQGCRVLVEMSSDAVDARLRPARFRLVPMRRTPRTANIQVGKLSLRPKYTVISAELRWVLLMMQHRPIQDIGPRPRTRKREKSSLFWLCSLVGTTSGKSLKLLLRDVIF